MLRGVVHMAGDYERRVAQLEVGLGCSCRGLDFIILIDDQPMPEPTPCRVHGYVAHAGRTRHVVQINLRTPEERSAA